MATNYPTSIQTFTAPDATDSMRAGGSNPHHTLSGTVSDTVEALQAKVGVDDSAVEASLDYRVAQLEMGGGLGNAPYHLSDVAAPSQERIFDFANGRIQTLLVDQSFTLAVDGPSDFFGIGLLVVYNDGAFFANMIYESVGFSISNGETAVFTITWDTEKGWVASNVEQSRVGDARPGIS